MGRLERLERFHPQLAGRHILLVDKSIYTPGYVSLMTGLERMRVTNYATLQLIPDLSLFMDNAQD